jgi:hypothetical protein
LTRSRGKGHILPSYADDQSLPPWGVDGLNNINLIR